MEIITCDEWEKHPMYPTFKSNKSFCCIYFDFGTCILIVFGLDSRGNHQLEKNPLNQNGLEWICEGGKSILTWHTTNYENKLLMMLQMQFYQKNQPQKCHENVSLYILNQIC